MDADLDLLLISVYCTADDLLPPARGNGRRRLSDAEVVALCVAQVVMGSPATGVSCVPLVGSWVICFPGCRASRRCTSGGRGWRRRSSGWLVCSRATARR